MRSRNTPRRSSVTPGLALRTTRRADATPAPRAQRHVPSYTYPTIAAVGGLFGSGGSYGEYFAPGYALAAGE